MSAGAHRRESGFTLIEVLVSLAVFAAIGLAAFTMVEGVVRVRDRVDGRLERLGEVQRALLIMTSDFEQAAPGRFAAEGGSVMLSRLGAAGAGGFEVAYALEDGTLARLLLSAEAAPVHQRLLGGVAALQWRFYDAETGWTAVWPPAGGGSADRPARDLGRAHAVGRERRDRRAAHAHDGAARACPLVKDRPCRDRERGVALITVLAAIGLATTVVFAMLSLQETAVRRSQRFADASQAMAAALGGEASAIAALRRDDPAVDHRREAWSAIEEAEAPIENGTFSLRIADAQARFNVNTLARGRAVSRTILRKILAAIEAPDLVADVIAARIAREGPVARVADLEGVGVDAGTLAQLAPFVTALPGQTQVNLNTADEALIAILLGDPFAARSLVALRERRGFVTREDLAPLRIIAPSGAGFASDHFEVAVDVEVGGARQRLTSLLRREGSGDDVEVTAILRAW